jgi:hypothetical protein
LQTERTSKTHLSVLDISTIAAMATWGCCHGDDGRPCLEPVKKDFSSGPASSSSSPLHLIRFPSSLAKRMTRSNSSLTSSPRNVFPAAQLQLHWPPAVLIRHVENVSPANHLRRLALTYSNAAFCILSLDLDVNWLRLARTTTLHNSCTLVASGSEPSASYKFEQTNGKWKGSFD